MSPMTKRPRLSTVSLLDVKGSDFKYEEFYDVPPEMED